MFAPGFGKTETKPKRRSRSQTTLNGVLLGTTSFKNVETSKIQREEYPNRSLGKESGGGGIGKPTQAQDELEVDIPLRAKHWLGQLASREAYRAVWDMKFES